MPAPRMQAPTRAAPVPRTSPARHAGAAARTRGGSASRCQRRDVLQHDAALRGADLVVEVVQEAQADQTVDAVPVLQVEDLNHEALHPEPERCKPGNTQRVPALTTDRRGRGARDTAVPRAVADLIEDL